MKFDERKQVEQMYREGKTIQEIAVTMGKCTGTIYRELRRGDTGKMDANGRMGYSAELAQKDAYEIMRQKRGMAAVKG